MIKKEEIQQFIECLKYLDKKEVIATIVFLVSFILFLCMLPVVL